MAILFAGMNIVYSKKNVVYWLEDHTCIDM